MTLRLSNLVRLDAGNQRRLNRVVAAHGEYGAANHLGVSPPVVLRLLDGGQARADAVARVVHGLDIWERRYVP